jgi:hypothetical protein
MRAHSARTQVFMGWDRFIFVRLGPTFWLAAAYSALLRHHLVVPHLYAAYLNT